MKTVGYGTNCKYAYKNLQCKILQTFHKNVINHLYIKKIHVQSKGSVYVGIFLRLLYILPCHSGGLSSHYMVQG